MCVSVQGSYLLAASNDFASRIWTLEDYRLRVSGGKTHKSCPGAPEAFFRSPI